MLIFRQNPLTGRRMQGGMKKNRDFRPVARFISKTIQDTAIVNTEDE